MLDNNYLKNLYDNIKLNVSGELGVGTKGEVSAEIEIKKKPFWKSLWDKITGFVSPIPIPEIEPTATIKTEQISPKPIEPEQTWWEKGWTEPKEEIEDPLIWKAKKDPLVKRIWDYVNPMDLFGVDKPYYEPTPEMKEMTNMDIFSGMGKTVFTDTNTFMKYEQEARNRHISPMEYMEKGAAVAVFSMLGAYGVQGLMTLLGSNPTLRNATVKFLQGLSKVGGIQGTAIARTGLVPMYAGLPADKILPMPPQGIKTVGELHTALSKVIPQFPAVIDKLISFAGEGLITEHSILSAAQEIPEKQVREKFNIVDKLKQFFGIKPEITPKEDIIAAGEEAKPLEELSPYGEKFVAPEAEIAETPEEAIPVISGKINIGTDIAKISGMIYGDENPSYEIQELQDRLAQYGESVIPSKYKDTGVEGQLIFWEEIEEEYQSPSTLEQQQMIQTWGKKRGISNEDVQFLIGSISGERSLSTLTHGEANDLISYLENMPEWNTDNPIPPLSSFGMGGDVPPDSPEDKVGITGLIGQMEMWSQRVESKNPNLPIYSKIVQPMVVAGQQRRVRYLQLMKELKETTRGITDEEINRITQWERQKGIELQGLGEAPDFDLTPKENEIRVKMRQLWDTRFEEFGVPVERYVEHYLPRIYTEEYLQKLGIETPVGMKFPTVPTEWLGVPKAQQPFFMKERTQRKEGELEALNFIELYGIYARRGLTALYRQNLEAVDPEIKKLPPRLNKQMRYWSNMLIGRPAVLEAELTTSLQGIVKDLTGKEIPDDILRTIAQYGLDLTYSGGLGLRVSSATKNLTQSLHNWSEMSAPWLFVGNKLFFSEEGKKILENSGILTGYAPFAMRKEMKETKLAPYRNAMMYLFQSVDKYNRGTVYLAELARSLHYGELYKKGDITWTDFIEKIDAKGFYPAFQNMVLPLFEQGKIKEGAHLVADMRQAMTQWRYQREVRPQWMHGALGRTFGQFMTWGTYNADMLWGRRIQRAEQLWKEDDKAAATYQIWKMIKHILMIVAAEKAIEYGAEKATGKDYDVNLLQMLIFGSIPSSFAPLPSMLANLWSGAVNTLKGYDWLAQENWNELKSQPKMVIPGRYAIRDWLKVSEAETPGEAIMGLTFPSFQPGKPLSEVEAEAKKEAQVNQRDLRELTKISGVGNSYATELLTVFLSIDNIKKQDTETIASAVKGISKARAQTILDYLNKPKKEKYLETLYNLFRKY